MCDGRGVDTCYRGQAELSSLQAMAITMTTSHIHGHVPLVQWVDACTCMSWMSTPWRCVHSISQPNFLHAGSKATQCSCVLQQLESSCWQDAFTNQCNMWEFCRNSRSRSIFGEEGNYHQMGDFLQKWALLMGIFDEECIHRPNPVMGGTEFKLKTLLTLTQDQMWLVVAVKA